MKSIFVCLTLIFPGLSLAKGGSGEPKPRPFCEAIATMTKAGTPSQKLSKYLDEVWKYLMRENPTWATDVGFPGMNDKLPDNSLEAIKRRKLEAKCSLATLKKIPRQGLKSQDRVTYDLQLRQLELDIEGQKFDIDWLVVDQMTGIHVDFADLLRAMPKASAKDIENMIARIEKLPTFIDNTIMLMSEGLKRKVTPVKMFLERIPGQIDGVLTEKIEDGPLFLAFTQMNSSISSADQELLRTKAREAILKHAYPAFKKLKAYVTKTYIPQARESIAMSSLPNGKQWYAYLVKSHTTTQMTPKELHDLGLSEVARIEKEMEKIKEQVKFKGDLQAFNKYLLTDSQFYYSNPRDLMTGYRDIAKQIDAELPVVFKKLPRLTYGIREIPYYKAADSPTAAYSGGSIAGRRAGYFEANTSDLKARPKWGMEALTLHEAMPGHHLQVALAQELEGLPEFRKHIGPTSYIEGWGLYAESLGEDMGFYKDPYSKYGRYTYEMWRAVRLVVDTGMHEFGWTRDRAINYFMEKIPNKRSEAEQEIDRYITIPGQALAYKVGQLKFLELRNKAKTVLGEKYDIRDYHDEVLRHGAIPLDVLETVVNTWLDEQTKNVSTHKTR